ncbi:MAG: RNA polymerase-binding protein DksA [Alphaproteobacteria bacterium]|nr:RNA polymerase-binding protein DksA [Alphaproteobacteria bacterium]
MSTITVPPNYKPSKDEEFMNDLQHEYFRLKLENWKIELLKESEETIGHLREGGLLVPDASDRATAEADRALELRTKDRIRKLISKIDKAIERVNNKTYGYCEVTGEPIGIKRLEARPVATMTIEAQENHELMEKTHSDK